MSKRIDVKNLDIYYGDFLAVKDVSVTIEPRSVTALIGPSGCGKSTFLRSLNRMHEVIPGAHVQGEVIIDGENLYGKGVDPVMVRRKVGMVFQKPNPFPTMSIRENVLAGVKLNNKRIKKSDADELVAAWKAGRTGFPIVDAGMRQLLGEGWMHNRVRMATASFLTKDLHVWWPVGARHFLDHLIDGDLASNNHGWQWVAGTGTDASPYFRVFNPVTQGRRFDPDGTYVRRWVPELAHLDGAAAHEPWKHDDGYAHDYPERIVDHAQERLEALARYDEAT